MVCIENQQYLLASSLEYPERIRVDSVVETSVLYSLSANFLIFPSFILLFLYSTVQKSAVQYSYWPAPSSIQRGLEWTQLLKRLIVCSLLVIKFSHFSLFHPSLFIQYSTEECSYWPAPLSIQRGLEWTQLLKRLSDCLFL